MTDWIIFICGLVAAVLAAIAQQWTTFFWALIAAGQAFSRVAKGIAFHSDE